MRQELLDHGRVELIETWGSDELIIEAARMSTDKGFEGWGPLPSCKVCGVRYEPEYLTEYGCLEQKKHKFTGDEGLLRYLWEHKHATPFEMGGLTLQVQAPLFVFREWHRHRTQSYNELSARYTPIPDVNYIPTVERLLMSGGANKQAQGTGVALTVDGAEAFQLSLQESYASAERAYQYALRAGVPKELARLVIPVGRYSRMRASANLRNWLGFLTLRLDPAAQWEIRQYAVAVGREIESAFPRTWALFNEGKH